MYDYSDHYREPTESDLGRISNLADDWTRAKTLVSAAQGRLGKRLRRLEQESRRCSESLIEALCGFHGAGPMGELTLPDGRMLRTRMHQLLPKLSNGESRQLINLCRVNGLHSEVRKLMKSGTGSGELRILQRRVRAKLLSQMRDENCPEWLGRYGFNVEMKTPRD